MRNSEEGYFHPPGEAKCEISSRALHCIIAEEEEEEKSKMAPAKIFQMKKKEDGKKLKSVNSPN